MYQKILLAVDGSGPSDHALREAAALATSGTAVKVITVADNPAYTFAAPYGIHYDLDALHHAVLAQAREVLDHALARLKGMGISAEAVLVDLSEGSHGTTIADAIIDEARRWPADVIVVGTHGRRGFRRALLGSVAEQVVRTASQPVLLARGPETAEGG